MISISFAITACTEVAELDRLLKQIDLVKQDQDEIVLQIDTEGTNQEMLDFLSNNTDKRPITKLFYSLNKDFAGFKNHLFENCKKDYIFQIDADEEVTVEQIYLLRQVVDLNPTVDCFLVPRINTVAGLTQEHIGQWGWRVDEHSRINWPDYQWRLCKNTGKIKWTGKVHERLEGYNQMAMLPAEDIYALGHHKTIQKQVKQNEFYNTI
jgi:glycosyltransferase involved in cell wall biosynthesis